MDIIRGAVETNDVATFERHVNLNSLCSKAFDDVVTIHLRKEKAAVAADTRKALEYFKNTTVAYFKGEILADVKGDGINLYSPTTDRGAQLGAAMVEALISPAFAKDNIKPQGYQIKDHKIEQNNNGEAIVAVEYYYPDFNKSIELKLKMKQLKSGKWQVTEFTNIAEFLDNVNKAKEDKIEAIDSEIRGKINQAVKFASWKWRRTGGGAFMNFKATAVLDNVSGKNIKNVRAKLAVEDKEAEKKHTFLKKSSLKDFGPIGKGEKKELTTDITLSKYVPDEKLAMDAHKDRLAVGIIVMAIEFEDGTVIERIKEDW